MERSINRSIINRNIVNHSSIRSYINRYFIGHFRRYFNSRNIKNSFQFISLFFILTFAFSEHVFSQSSLSASQWNIKPSEVILKNLHAHGDVFNIEGGRPRKALHKDKIWLNLAMVLDRPLLDGKTWHEITQANTFPLKEMSIKDYNETNVNLGLLLITNYYIENGRKILNKQNDEPIHMVIHVHRDTSGPKMINNIAKLMTNCLQHKFVSSTDDKSIETLPILKLPEKNMTISFRKSASNIGSYDDVDILFSVSLVGGLNPTLKSGSLTIPKEVIPFDIAAYQLFKKDKYKVENRLHKDLKAILAQSQDCYFEKLNSQFKSHNEDKKETARTLTHADFHPVTLLQIDNKFSPKDHHAIVTIY